MVVSRSPPPVRRSPRKQDPFVLDSSTTSFSRNPLTNQQPLAERPSVTNGVPSTPVQSIYPSLPKPNPTPTAQVPSALSDFPSLDAMASAGREQRELASLSNGHGHAPAPSSSISAAASSFSTSSAASSSSATSHGATQSTARKLPTTASSSTTTVPSSLPRPTSVRHFAGTASSSSPQDRRTGRSSLTNSALEKARMLAGDETPIAVSQAKAAAAKSQSMTGRGTGMNGDVSADATPQAVPGQSTAPDIVNMSIDVEHPQLPTALPHNPAALEGVNAADIRGDSSTSSQHSSAGQRRNGQDRPVQTKDAAAPVSSSSAVQSSGYDFDRYLDGELDPFNRASRTNLRRESRPLPAPQDRGMEVDEDENGGDTTARGSMPPPPAAFASATNNAKPVESTPRVVQQLKASSTPLQRAQLSPHASPSISSRKLSHLKAAATSANANGHSATDASDLSSRFDPSARIDRLQNLEMNELRKRLASSMQELEKCQEALSSAKEESEGWASECASLQDQLVSTKAECTSRMSLESRRKQELETRLNGYKIESDERALKLVLAQQQHIHYQVQLQYSKNEVTFSESKLQEQEHTLEMQKDQLRIQLMLEKKRADLITSYYRVHVRDNQRLKKKLVAQKRTIQQLEKENLELASSLESAQAQAGAKGNKKGDSDGQAAEVQGLKNQIAEYQEMETMMAQTRKNWKVERKDLLARISILEKESTTTRPSSVIHAVTTTSSSHHQQQQQQRRPQRDAELEKEYPPSSPVFSKSKNGTKTRKPMQGASEIEVPSELGYHDDDDDDDDGAMESDSPVQPPPHKTKSNAPKSAISSSSTTNLTKTKASTKRIEMPPPPPHLASPLVPFTKAKTQADGGGRPKASKPTTTAKQKSSSSTKAKNWRDEVEPLTDYSSDYGSDSDDGGGPRRANGAGKNSKGSSTKTSGSKSKSTSSSSNTVKNSKKRSAAVAVAVGIDYDDQTADPSATPMIRRKRAQDSQASEEDDDDDEEAEAEDSVLGHRTSQAQSKSKSKSNTKSGSQAPTTKTNNNNNNNGSGGGNGGADGAVVKKKRKLLNPTTMGMGKNLAWNSSTNPQSTTAAVGGGMRKGGGIDPDKSTLAPCYDLPLELSPIKPHSQLSQIGGAGSRKPPSLFSIGANHAFAM